MNHLSRMKHLPTIGVFLILMAGCTAGSGEDDLTVTERLRRTLPAQVGQFLREGQQALGMGQYTRALTLADSATTHAPDLADGYYLRGLALSSLYRFEAADTAFTQALLCDPQYHGAHFHLGNNAFFLGRNRDALRHYRAEREALGDDREARASVTLQVGRVYARLGVADSARTAYAEALALDSLNAQAYSWLAELEDDEGELEQALATARRALVLAPENLEYRYQVGALLFRTGQYEAALGPLETVVEKQPWHVGAHYNLGRTLTALGRADEGRRYLARTDTLQALQSEIVRAQFATTRNPTDAARWRTLAALLNRAGRTDEARRALTIARTLF